MVGSLELGAPLESRAGWFDEKRRGAKAEDAPLAPHHFRARDADRTAQQHVREPVVVIVEA